MLKAKKGMLTDGSNKEAEKHEWNKMKAKGKAKYLLNRILLGFVGSVFRGIIILFILYLIDSLWFDGQYSDLKNVEINKVLIIFLFLVVSGLIVDTVDSLYRWNKYRKRYENLD